MATNGRPSKLTPELQQSLCEAIAAGNYYQAACGRAGVDYTTFRKWMLRGKRSRRGKFFDFFHAVKKAEINAELRAVGHWQQHMPDNWQACRDFLARRYPERWGPKESVEIGGKKGQPVEIKQEIDWTKLSDEQLEQLENLLALAGGNPEAMASGLPGEVQPLPG